MDHGLQGVRKRQRNSTIDLSEVYGTGSTPPGLRDYIATDALLPAAAAERSVLRHGSKSVLRTRRIVTARGRGAPGRDELLIATIAPISAQRSTWEPARRTITGRALRRARLEGRRSRFAGAGPRDDHHVDRSAGQQPLQTSLFDAGVWPGCARPPSPPPSDGHARPGPPAPGGSANTVKWRPPRRRPRRGRAPNSAFGASCHRGAWAQTVRRLRPFLRRAARTRRPFLVAIRARNPWTRLRRRLCGLERPLHDR